MPTNFPVEGQTTAQPGLNLMLGLPLYFVFWQTSSSPQTFFHSRCRFQKEWSKNEKSRCPNSTDLNSSADDSFRHLTRAVPYDLFQANFCFWQYMARIKIARSAAGKSKQAKTFLSLRTYRQKRSMKKEMSVCSNSIEKERQIPKPAWRANKLL